MKKLRKYLFLLVFAFIGIMFFSCKTEEKCACRAIKEAIYRESADDPGVIIRVSNIVSDTTSNESGGIYDAGGSGAVVIAYYDNDCNRISNEPETGVYCEELSDGRMIKRLK